MEQKSKIQVFDELPAGEYYCINSRKFVLLLSSICAVAIVFTFTVSVFVTALLFDAGTKGTTHPDPGPDVRAGVVTERAISNCETQCDDLLDSIARCRGILDGMSETK